MKINYEINWDVAYDVLIFTTLVMMIEAVIWLIARAVC